MTGAPAVTAAVQADLSSLRMQVTPANVLQVHHALLAESRLLGEKVAVARVGARIGEPGKDEVSKIAVKGFQPKIDRLFVQLDAYVQALADAAEEIAVIAKRYGHTEDQIGKSFDRYQKAHPAPKSPMVSPSFSLAGFPTPPPVNQGPR